MAADMSVEKGQIASCEQDDHDRVWQMGREAGYRDALIALAERGGSFFDELDRDIADALRRDQEYVAAHDAAVLRAAAEGIPGPVRGQILREARDEIAQMLSGFRYGGAHTRATWAVEWLSHMATRVDGGES